MGPLGALLLDVLVLLLALSVVVPALRRGIYTRLILRLVSRTLPKMGETERIALEAGTVWWDGELFSGNPNWTRLLQFKPLELTPKEQAFIDGPVAELCAMLDEWRIEGEKDLPAEVWRFIKSRGFFGMIIPESYGGLGFSAAAHSAVVVKLSSRSLTGARVAVSEAAPSCGRSARQASGSASQKPLGRVRPAANPQTATHLSRRRRIA